MNAHLTALDRFFSRLSLGPAVRRRGAAPKLAPRALDARRQNRYLRAVERRPLARDRAIRQLLFYSGVRIAEPVALDDDVPLSARKARSSSGPARARPHARSRSWGRHRPRLGHRVAH
ncbi:hypothetical protein [Streptomyces nojiriensis]|uniref:hypothetical protein n=1 Tax=Streptomyces nojiriensis TaxID=66374 RepID=UPI00366362B8